jgi:outer membrane lipoprotein-sorting protein
MPSVGRLRSIFIFLAVLPLSGCLFRSHSVKPPITPASLQSSTQQQLVEYINIQAAKIQSMQATVDIDTSVGGAKKGKVTDYEQIRGYVLARKPAMLRMIGLVPIVRNRMFDMVSDGQNFELWIPTKNRFVIGRNDMQVSNPQQPLENLRPQVIYDALLLREIDPEHDIAVMENESHLINVSKGRNYLQSDYVIDVIQKGHRGWFLSRKIVFSRTDLLPSRQMIYNEDEDLVTDARYEAYKDYEGIKFPSKIEISRPQEEYDIALTFVKLELNLTLADDKFELEKPPDAEVIHLGEQKTAPAPKVEAPVKR